jgi:hypothetical protein
MYAMALQNQKLKTLLTAWSRVLKHGNSYQHSYTAFPAVT